jgi:hypothetical protein
MDRQTVKSFDRIAIDPVQMGGVPCVRHLRIPVATVLRLLVGGLGGVRYSPGIRTSKRKISVSAYVSPLHRLWNGRCLFRTQLEVSDRQRATLRLADLLAAAGHDAVHVRAYAMQAAGDEEILARALTEDRISVSADSDFSAILAAREAERPSLSCSAIRISWFRATTWTCCCARCRYLSRR